MAKLTLLEIVQNILSSMDDDEINSLGDTVEAGQIAEVVKETYYEMFGNLAIPQHDKIIPLTNIGDPDLPNYIKIPENVKGIKWLKYKDESENEYTYVDWVEPEVFADRFISSGDFTDGSSYVDIVDPNGYSYRVRSDQHPQFYTSFDDQTLIFDSFNVAYDTTLQASKAMCWGQSLPMFQLTDSFIPSIDDNLFPLLLSEAKATSFNYFKQISSAKDEQRSRRQRVRWQANRHKARIDEQYGLDFSRRRNSGRVRLH